MVPLQKVGIILTVVLVKNVQFEPGAFAQGIGIVRLKNYDMRSIKMMMLEIHILQEKHLKIQ